ncbi:MAG: Paracoccus phage Shpa, partial [Pseudomonadota bacterium]
MIERSNTAQWLQSRLGCLTASRMADAMATLKSGKPAEAQTKLAYELLAERLTQASVAHYVTPAMQWGIDNQSGAIAAYENARGVLVGPESFFLHDSIDFFGATPDGLVDQHGLVEVKCPTSPTFVRWAMTGDVPVEYKPQMLAQLACTGRHWVDFVAYDPRMPARQQLFIRRFHPEREEIAAIEAAAREFLGSVEKMFEQ